MDHTSIADIARDLKVSTATVSRVLNGKPDVGAETRARVLAALRALDYRPRLARVAYDGIGICLPPGDSLASFYNMRLLEGLSLAAGARDCTVTLLPSQLCWYRGDEVDGLLRRHHLRGLIYIMRAPAEGVLAELRAHRVPHVVVDPAQAPPATVAVGTDIGLGISLAVEHLVRLGHRRIALLNRRELDGGRNTQRAASLRAVCARLGLPCDDVVEFDGPTDRNPIGPRLALAVEELLSRPGRPTAIISGGEWLTIPALLALAARGLRLPRDLSFVAFHDAPSASHSNPPLTAIRQRIDELGQMAVDLLIRLADGDQAIGHGLRTIPMELVIRESSGLAPGIG